MTPVTGYLTSDASINTYPALTPGLPRLYVRVNRSDTRVAESVHTSTRHVYQSCRVRTYAFAAPISGLPSLDIRVSFPFVYRVATIVLIRLPRPITRVAKSVFTSTPPYYQRCLCLLTKLSLHTGTPPQQQLPRTRNNCARQNDD